METEAVCFGLRVSRLCGAFQPFSAGAEYACQDIFVGDPLYSYAYMGDESFLMAEYFYTRCLLTMLWLCLPLFMMKIKLCMIGEEKCYE